MVACSHFISKAYFILDENVISFDSCECESICNDQYSAYLAYLAFSLRLFHQDISDFV